uniref:33 kDa protein n=1 Tax=Rice virus X TaxID=106518 RepID=Q9E9R0_9TOMB|nr:33 kDa protein [Rice virus X]
METSRTYNLEAHKSKDCECEVSVSHHSTHAKSGKKQASKRASGSKSSQTSVSTNTNIASRRQPGKQMVVPDHDASLDAVVPQLETLEISQVASRDSNRRRGSRRSATPPSDDGLDTFSDTRSETRHTEGNWAQHPNAGSWSQLSLNEQHYEVATGTPVMPPNPGPTQPRTRLPKTQVHVDGAGDVVTAPHADWDRYQAYLDRVKRDYGGIGFGNRPLVKSVNGYAHMPNSTDILGHRHPMFIVWQQINCYGHVVKGLETIDGMFGIGWHFDLVFRNMKRIHEYLEGVGCVPYHKLKDFA